MADYYMVEHQGWPWWVLALQMSGKLTCRCAYVDCHSYRAVKVLEPEECKALPVQSCGPEAVGALTAAAGYADTAELLRTAYELRHQNRAFETEQILGMGQPHPRWCICEACQAALII